MPRLSYSKTREIMGIVNQFQVKNGTIDMIESFGDGRINRTFKITMKDGNERYEYLLQNVNHFVFPDTKGLMRNVTLVTEHIRAASENALEYIKCKAVVEQGSTNGEYIFIDGTEEHNHWRMYHYIDADVYPCITNPHHAYMLGDAIARFSKSLDGFDATKLIETIPDFHNTPKRYEALLHSVVFDAINHKNRVSGNESVENWVRFVMERRDKLGILMNALTSGEIPYRVAHNDPKLNNVLFDKKKNEPICMIDLDTIMPGTGLFDVGDALRNIANTASEDDKTVENVSFSLEIYKEFVNGYIAGMSDKLTEREKELIPVSVWTIAMELGMRFLKDHIDGNLYFKTDYDGQNLERASIQLTLAACIEKLLDDGTLHEVLKSVV